MDCVLGSLAFVAIFFSVDGSAVAARSPEDCPIQQRSVLWYIFVTLFSILLNFIPRSLMYFLAWRDFEQEVNHKKQLQRRRLWDVVFWTVAIFLSCLHLLVIMSFSANLGEVDEWKWILSFMVVLLRKVLIVPLVACIFSGLAFEVMALTRKDLLANPPRKLGMDFALQSSQISNGRKSVWEEKVEELALRGITVAQLLDFYADVTFYMPHFDPQLSTTHDVVRQVVIPRSLALHTGNKIQVLIQCQPLKEPSTFSVCAVDDSNVKKLWKPWKGGGTVLLQDPWEGTFVLQGLHEESVCIRLEDGESSSIDAQLCQAIVPSEKFSEGFAGEIQVGLERLHLSITWEDAAGDDTGVFSPDEHDFSSIPIPGKSFIPCGCDFSPENPYNVDVNVSEVEQSSALEALPTQVGYAYATAVNLGEPMMAYKMVTHNWGNRFAHLIGAIFADALQQETYDGVVHLLENKDFEKVYRMMDERNQLEIPYWVCAFSVNQHAGICARAPPLDSQGHRIVACSCSREKHFEGDFSEMNKFDDMMHFLKMRLREVYSEVRLEQVVAMDVSFTLLTRVWCVAELVEADSLHISQAVKIHSGASRNVCLSSLATSDVRRAEASFPADKELVLSKIEDVEGFNHRLQDLMLHRLDSFLGHQSMRASTLCDEIVGAALTVAM